ncbi:hypothetical protein HG531_007732 [Fusarium graminearum]|nr:hypothetical protein HG531_007732 [Fusarium graminearum]
MLNHRQKLVLLLSGSFQNLFFDSIFRDKSIHNNLFGLADTMGSIHGLQIGLRVPITIIQNNDVGSCQVDAQTTSTCCKEKDELLRPRLIVLINSSDSVLVGGSTINSAVLVLSENAVIFKDVQQSTHLGEDENTAALLLESLKQFVEYSHFTCIVNKMLVGGVRRAWLGTFEQIRMVAALSKLHDNVEQSSLGLTLAACAVDSVDVLFQNLLIPLDLHFRHTQIDVDFLLGQQALLHVALHTTQ